MKVLLFLLFVTLVSSEIIMSNFHNDRDIIRIPLKNVINAPPSLHEEVICYKVLETKGNDYWKCSETRSSIGRTLVMQDDGIIYLLYDEDLIKSDCNFWEAVLVACIAIPIAIGVLCLVIAFTDEPETKKNQVAIKKEV